MARQEINFFLGFWVLGINTVCWVVGFAWFVDSLFLLRKKLNIVENEKLDAISAANQEVRWRVFDTSWRIAVICYVEWLLIYEIFLL